MQTNNPVIHPETKISEQAPANVAQNVPELTQKKSGKFSNLIFIIIALISLTIAGYFAYQNYQLKQQQKTKGLALEIIPTQVPQPSSTPTIQPPTVAPTVNPTANWETYTNDEYGYKFKYPSEWILKITNNNDINSPLYVIKEILEGGEDNNYTFLIHIWDNPNKFSLTNWLKFMKDSNALPLPVETVELISNYTVANKPSFKIWNDPISEGKIPGKCIQACPILDIYFVYQNKAYRVQLNYEQEVTQESLDIFEQILSTFEFIN